MGAINKTFPTLDNLMFSLNHGYSLLPLRFKHYFSFHKEVSREKSNDSYDNKYANDFHLPFCRANLRKFSVSFQGPAIFFSSLGNEIKVLLVSPHSKQSFVNISVRIINY